MIRPAQQSDLEDLIAEHGASVFGVCRRTTGDTETALDAFQETFLVFTQRWGSLDQESDLGPWLRETARRCALARIRTSVRFRAAGLTAEHPSLAIEAPSSLECLSQRDSARILQEEFERLDPFDQKLLYLAFVEGMAHREIACQVGCPRGSLYTKLRAASSRLEARLKKRGLAAGILVLLVLFHESRVALAATTSPMFTGLVGNPSASGMDGKASASMWSGLFKWPVMIACMLFLGGLFLAARYSFQPTKPLEQRIIQKTPASDARTDSPDSRAGAACSLGCAGQFEVSHKHEA